MTPHYRCWAEVDLAALRANLAWIHHRVGPTVKVMTVVKADAYGHGLKPIAALLMQSGTDVFGVANLAEARAIRSVGQGWPVLMLGACLPEEVETAVRENISVTLSSAEEARVFSRTAVRLHRTVAAHLKIDTGMGRLGVQPEAAVDVAREVQQLPGLALEAVYTHFSSAEDDARFSARQARRFRAALERLAEASIRPRVIHASNSAALLHEPEMNFQLVRPGLLVYGVLPAGRRRLNDKTLVRQIRPALSWKCRVALVKPIPAGTTLSYGHIFTAPRPMRVATVTAGYGDGYPRAGSGRAEVLIGGRRCRVLGRVTMDQMIVDVTRLASSVKPGDEVVLIGRQGRESLTAGELAAWCGTIPWEILTGITYRVPRVYRGGQAA